MAGKPDADVRRPLLDLEEASNREDRGESASKGNGHRCVLWLVLGAEFVVNLLVAVLVPFFPDYARTTLHASPWHVGVTFALFPLSILCASPLMGMASHRLGRGRVFWVGLWLLGLGTVGFGLGANWGLGWCLGMRGVQGIGAAAVNVAGLSLLLQSSPNVERDVGLQQAASGLGFICGPPLGGALYGPLGFQGLFLLLAALPILQALVLPLLLLCLPKRPPRPPSPTTPSPSLVSLLCRPSVLGLWWLLLVTYMALGFLDPLISPHLQRCLGVSPAHVGVVFMLPSVLYTIVSALVPRCLNRHNHKQAVLCGLSLLCVGYVLIGPAPFLHPMLSSLDQPKLRALSWGLQLGALVLCGIGFALILVCGVPLLRVGLYSGGGGGYEWGDDVVASLNATCAAAGECLGPLLGGVVSQWVPAYHELSCIENPDIDGCVSGFPWSSVVFLGLLSLTLVLFLLTAPRLHSPPNTPTHHNGLEYENVGVPWLMVPTPHSRQGSIGWEEGEEGTPHSYAASIASLRTEV